MKIKSCELCNADAAVFCPSDAAFLCRSCDFKVHEANFLVARHVRHPINYSDSKIFAGDEISGSGGDSQPSSASSSVCVSSTTSPAKEEYSGERKSRDSSNFDSSQRREKPAGVDWLKKAEGIFVSWCGELGFEADVAVRMACGALRVCKMEEWTVLPFRVCLAASMWLGLRLAGEKPVMTWHVLKRLEEVSGVPAKIILAAESKVGGVLRKGRQQQRRRRLELEEGWAEC